MSGKPSSSPKAPSPPGTWLLQDAKARLSEVVRRAAADGPQRLTVHGREAAVVVSAEEYRRLTGQRTGQALIDAMQAMPFSDGMFDRESIVLPVRDPVEL